MIGDQMIRYASNYALIRLKSGSHREKGQIDVIALKGMRESRVEGDGGDANPWPRGELEHARQLGATLAAEVARVLATKLAPVRPQLRMASRAANLALRAPDLSRRRWALPYFMAFFQRAERTSPVRGDFLKGGPVSRTERTGEQTQGSPRNACRNAALLGPHLWFEFGVPPSGGLGVWSPASAG